MRDTLFPGQTVVGISLPKLASLANGMSDSARLVLPAIQRTSLWRPAQLRDLWDSLLRGMPIGSFYLQPGGQDSSQMVSDLAGEYGQLSHESDKPLALKRLDTLELGHTAVFDLIDGQQRLRSLMTGMYGPGPERRILWVNLSESRPEDEDWLRVTSSHQPFGYSKDGTRLSMDERRKARERFEKRYPPKHDHELFEWSMSPKRPIPPEAQYDRMWFCLHDLWTAVREGKVNRDELKRLTENKVHESVLGSLTEQIERVTTAEAALIKVELPHPEDILPLFERIGAGGTPLSPAEQYFSIYKYYKPSIGNLVQKIYQETGRLIGPADLAVCAIRIANKLRDDYSNREPSLPRFETLMRSNEQGDGQALSQKLDSLCPTDNGGDSGLLTRAMRVLFSRGNDLGLVVFDRKSLANGPVDIGLPAVVRAALPRRLIQVLLYWAIKNNCDSAAEWAAHRAELIRFILFWVLCVHNDDTAASDRAFEFVGTTPTQKGEVGSPDQHSVFRKIYEKLCQEGLAYRIADPNRISGIFHAYDANNTMLWPDAEHWYPSKSEDGQFASRWAASRSKHLMWLQRRYLEATFETFDPAAGREDETPFDLDHICPLNDWGADWRLIQFQGIEDTDRKRMQHSRRHVGNAIGNFRLVDASQNRHDGDDQPVQKIPALSNPTLTDEDRRTLSDMLLDLGTRSDWVALSVEKEGARSWTEIRARQFQSTVQARSAWLYQCFFDQAGFLKWVLPARAQDTSSMPLGSEQSQ